MTDILSHLLFLCNMQDGKLITSCSRRVVALEVMSHLIRVPKITWPVVVTSIDTILVPVVVRYTFSKVDNVSFSFKITSHEIYFLR